MKGISPMIATVLLIAFTIAIGGILSIWLTSYTRTTTESVGGGTEAMIKCSSSVLSIKNVDNATANSVKILVYYVSGSENLTSPKCEAIQGATINSTTTISPSGTITPGSTFACNINTSGGVTAPDFVRVSAMCQTNIPISVDCNPIQSCW